MPTETNCSQAPLTYTTRKEFHEGRHLNGTVSAAHTRRHVQPEHRGAVSSILRRRRRVLSALCQILCVWGWMRHQKAAPLFAALANPPAMTPNVFENRYILFGKTSQNHHYCNSCQDLRVQVLSCQCVLIGPALDFYVAFTVYDTEAHYSVLHHII